MPSNKDLKPLPQLKGSMSPYLVQNFRRVAGVASEVISLDARVDILEATDIGLDARLDLLEAKGYLSQAKWGPM